MGIGKKRSFAHIKGESGVAILKEHFPKEWVVREYAWRRVELKHCIH